MPGGKLETAAGYCDLLGGLHEPNLLECFSLVRNFSLRRESFAVYVDSVLVQAHRRLPLYAVNCWVAPVDQAQKVRSTPQFGQTENLFDLRR